MIRIAVLALAAVLLSAVAALARDQSVASIHIADRIGCKKWDTLTRLYGFLRDGDEAAARRLFADAARRGGCIRFRAGERVYLTEIGMWRGSVRLRIKGDPVQYWCVLLGKPAGERGELLAIE